MRRWEYLTITARDNCPSTELVRSSNFVLPSLQGFSTCGVLSTEDFFTNEDTLSMPKLSVCLTTHIQSFIGRLPSMTTLEISACYDIANPQEWYTFLKGLTNLERLSISSMGLRGVDNPPTSVDVLLPRLHHLEILEFDGDAMTGFPSISAPSLRTLRFLGTNTECLHSLINASRTLRHVRHLWMSHYYQDTVESLATLLSLMPEVVSVYLNHVGIETMALTSDRALLPRLEKISYGHFVDYELLAGLVQSRSDAGRPLKEIGIPHVYETMVPEGYDTLMELREGLGGALKIEECRLPADPFLEALWPAE